MPNFFGISSSIKLKGRGRSLAAFSRTSLNRSTRVRARTSIYGPPPRRQLQQQHAQPTESSRAPSPRKTEFKSRADHLYRGDGRRYGRLARIWIGRRIFDSPEIGIVRKNKLNSGLLRYDGKGDLDWWHVARDTLAQEKADYVIMMLGIGDRQDIGEKDLAKEADAKAKDQKDQQAKDEADKKPGQKPAKPDNPVKADNSEDDRDRATDQEDGWSCRIPWRRMGKSLLKTY